MYVAKFEAGFAQGNNNAPIVSSNIYYTQSTSAVSKIESGKTTDNSSELARNWLDGIYGETKMAIKYPTFQPITYSMNYISINDSYQLCRHLTDNGNIYGFLSNQIDSHLMKNSEWGMISYLSYSQYRN